MNRLSTTAYIFFLIFVYLFFEQTSTESNAKMLLEGLVQLSEQQLLQYDDLLVVDEVDKGRKNMFTQQIIYITHFSVQCKMLYHQIFRL